MEANSDLNSRLVMLSYQLAFNWSMQTQMLAEGASIFLVHMVCLIVNSRDLCCS